MRVVLRALLSVPPRWNEHATVQTAGPFKRQWGASMMTVSQPVLKASPGAHYWLRAVTGVPLKCVQPFGKVYLSCLLQWHHLLQGWCYFWGHPASVQVFISLHIVNKQGPSASRNPLKLLRTYFANNLVWVLNGLLCVAISHISCTKAQEITLNSSPYSQSPQHNAPPAPPPGVVGA